MLYMYIMQRKPLSWQERMLKIIDKGSPLPTTGDFDFLTLILPTLRATSPSRKVPCSRPTKKSDSTRCQATPKQSQPFLW